MWEGEGCDPLKKKDGQRRDTCFPPEKKKALIAILAKCIQCVRPSQPGRGTGEAERGKPADLDARPSSRAEGQGSHRLPAR